MLRGGTLLLYLCCCGFCLPELCMSYYIDYASLCIPQSAYLENQSLTSAKY